MTPPHARRPIRQDKIDFRCPCSQTLNLTALIDLLPGNIDRWTLYPYYSDRQPRPPAITSKHCPTCGRNFSPFSGGQIKDHVWPGNSTS